MLLCSRLKPIDIVVLKKLSEVVNVVPVIAKSDSLTIEERHAFKQRVCSPNEVFLTESVELRRHGIDQSGTGFSQHQIVPLRERRR